MRLPRLRLGYRCHDAVAANHVLEDTMTKFDYDLYDVALLPEQRAAACWVRDNWSATDCEAVMQHVFTAPPTSEDRRARMEWVRENRATVRGVKVTPATAWTKCFAAQRSLTVREANPHMYV